ncbi:MAG: LamG domain-containing protein, partial [Sedimentisphaerales bacterium]|nr:LamG domain-containing protein [Sedimentisphaerales bacterium]
SEVTRTLNADWTQDDVVALTLFYYGDAGNAVEPMYVAVNGNAVVTNEDPEAVLANDWVQWNIALQAFSDQGVNLANVTTLSIGLGNKSVPQAGGGSGHVFFDDIRLYRSLPDEPEPGTEPIDPGTDSLVAYYAFENNTDDGSGNGYAASAFGNPQYVSGPTGYGTALSFDGANDYVRLPIGSVIASMSDITVSTWANFSNLGGSWQRIWDFGKDDQVYMFVTPRMGTTGQMRFAITAAGADTETNITASATLPSGWHHVAAVIDSASMTMMLYQDGRLIAEGPSPLLPSGLGETTENFLGRSQYAADAYYSGSLDEFRIYDRALSVEEILFLAGK